MEHALAAMRDRPDQTPRLGSIATPTLIIVGAGDVITPPDVARAMAAALPHATVRVIPGAGHMAAMEQPGAVNEAMGAFLDRSG
jgi:pimeloyl-ACP methyl ester carboxylesterase